MNWLRLIIVLLAAFLGVFAEAAFELPRRLLGAQIHFLPPLMVFCALKTDIPTIATVAVIGGLWTDGLSANPLGASMLPLLWIGLILHGSRDWILRDFPYAQFVLGVFASAAVPLLKLVLVLTLGRHPLIGWGSLWQLAVVALTGGVLTLMLFRALGVVIKLFAYQSVSPISFPPDREIRRGRY